MSLAIIGLLVILAAVLVMPFTVKQVEEQLEIFLFIMGVAAVTITSQWDKRLFLEGVTEPLKITAAVFIAGILFKLAQKYIAKKINLFLSAAGPRLFIFAVVAGLGFLSSIITAIIAALVLVEIISHIKLDKKTETTVVVMACLSIGLGAVLTPVGEPLATIVIAKLKGEPYHAGFWFLAFNLWTYIVPGVFAVALAAVFAVPKAHKAAHGLTEDRRETFADITVRTVKVYFFVMALIFLGQGFKPLIDAYISKISYLALYWINITSAILDNATLTAAEIGPSMTLKQINAALLGLLISGGMLIPGNIPNIISAGKLKIKSRDWAAIGVPAGFVMMIIYFVVILLVK
jgi:predicted cation transporter